MQHFGLKSIHFGAFWPCVQTKAPSTLIFLLFFIYFFFLFLKHLVFVSFVVSSAFPSVQTKMFEFADILWGKVTTVICACDKSADNPALSVI